MIKTNTAVQPQYRYCRKKQCHCTNANWYGECSITACNKARFPRKPYSNTAMQVIMNEKDRRMSKEERFVKELIGYIFAYPDDDYMTMECLCRKLHKHGLIKRKDGEWTCNFTKKADTPQTERIAE